MNTTYRTVRLIQNQLYPTFQLHAVMANKKTAPQDGLRLAALITMEWLRKRLGEKIPAEMQHIPAPSLYAEVSGDCLTSFHIHSGFVVDVVALPNQGIWSLQITEPDLGSDPGNPNQMRQAVPGRVIETNIGYRALGPQLECGFQTVISDPEGTKEKAEVYRLAVVRRLLEHPDFGLRQITRLGYEAARLDTVSQLKDLLGLWRSKENHLPCVLFTTPREETPPPPQLGQSDFLSMMRISNLSQLPTATREIQKPPYDVEKFAQAGAGYCRTYQVSDNVFDRLSASIGANVKPGDILVLEPASFGGSVRVLPYRLSKSRQEETMTKLRSDILCYPREKTVNFGTVVFLSEARENLLHRTADAIQRSQETAEVWEQKMAMLEARWKARWEEQEQKYLELAGQLDRQRQYQARLERELEHQRERQKRELDVFQAKMQEKDSEITYLRRKLTQPKNHGQIADWVRDNFSERLLLHPRAEVLLEDRSARNVNVGLICDALDFLATDYWERRYGKLSKDEMNNRCSEKYGRPFEIKPTGTTTIEFTPTEYKIKYFIGARGKPVESPLDYHLRVGNDPENLLRIYFLHDDEKKLIVVGSLPRHLRAVTIR